MAVTIAELVILGLLADWVFRRLKVPGLVGILLLGVAFGPHVLGLMSDNTLRISADLRMIALLVILLRAGLELSKSVLKRVGKQVLLLSCVPAILEGAAITVLGPPLLGLTYLESAILGAVLSAVSPAVVVPMMISFIDRRMGARKGIPTMTLAASSGNCVFAVVAFSGLLGMYAGGNVNLAFKIAEAPLSLITGTLAGLGLGIVFCRMFERWNPRATKRVLILLGASILLMRLEELAKDVVPFAALVAVMVIGYIILDRREHFAHELSAKLGKIWIFAEIMLYTMVGAQVNVGVAMEAGLHGMILIALALVARSIGTYLCLLGSDFTFRERMFVVVSYIPKATVQAAIGGVPLVVMKAQGMNTRPGELIVAVAVLSILVTSPLGAWAISIFGDRVLKPETESGEAWEAAHESEASEEP